MSAAGDMPAVPREPRHHRAALMSTVSSPRFYVYVASTILAVLTSYHLGKDMLWDTMDYHVYAGFSALHDRFGLDYFAAGPQAYFNPYAYVPFYLLLRSRLTPLEDASILAAVQSGILWLTYEMAMVIGPRDWPKRRLAIAMLSAALAFANPLVIDQFGSSFADITTGELALGGWLLLLTALRVPSTARVLGAALLLGAATALKPTNAVHAIGAATMLLFIPRDWNIRFRHAAIFAAALTAGFVLVEAPWSIHLARHFGNPLFPLLNGVFRSPEFTTSPLVSYRFIPTSFGAALVRPFAIAAPHAMVDVEWSAPDLRYALLLVLALALALAWGWRRIRNIKPAVLTPECARSNRALTALGCGVAVDWALWLTASGNGRYFMPGACVAAVLSIALIFRLFTAWPRVRNYLLAAVFGVQIFQLCAGTEFRTPLPWPNGPWFSLSVPRKLASTPELYFLVGAQTHSYIVPYLAAGSGFVNLDGGYVLGPDGANGKRIEALIGRFAPHLKVLVRDPRLYPGKRADLPGASSVGNVLEPFGLRADPDRCSRIVARGVTVGWTDAFTGRVPGARPMSAAHTAYLMACNVTWAGSPRVAPLPGQRAADLAFDHLEEACPALFQPARPVDTVLGDPVRGYLFKRRYGNTDIAAWIANGRVKFQGLIGGHEQDAGTERAWEMSPLPVRCGREHHGFLQRTPPGA